MNTLQAIMDRGVFPVTFHNYRPWRPPPGGPWAVKDWADLGITVGRMAGRWLSRRKNVPWFGLAFPPAVA